MKETCIIIGCEMLRDEIEFAYKQCNCTWPIIWIPRKYHNTPEKLKNILQETIDQYQEYDKVLLTFGCCGGGTDGLISENTSLHVVRCDDCIHMLLYSKKEQKSLVDKGVIYLTNGWTQDEESIVWQYQYTKKKYGKTMCETIMHMMFGNFHEMCVVDTGAYDLPETITYAKEASEVTKLSLACCKGSVELLQDLFSGAETPEMLAYPPGQMVKKTDFLNGGENP